MYYFELIEDAVDMHAGACAHQSVHELQSFETQFTYPLNAHQSFRITHGFDYSRFYRSMGQACVVIARDALGIAGVVAATLRTVHMNEQAITAAYLGDLKVAQRARGQGLVRQMGAQLLQRFAHVQQAYCAVMAGNTALPSDYTGKHGLPGLQRVGSVCLARLTLEQNVASTHQPPQALVEVPAEQGKALFTQLMHHTAYASGGDESLRSELTPTWFTTADGQAVARFEDTAQAKQLWTLDGVELRSAHCGAFAARTTESGQVLLRSLTGLAALRGYPALFVTAAVGTVSAQAIHMASADSQSNSTIDVYALGPQLQRMTTWFIPSSEV